MVVFAADIFQKERLLFRTNRVFDYLGTECAASEAELISRDMTSIGRGKIVVSPQAASAYTDREFQKCALKQQPVQFDRVDPINWAAAPEKVDCCELKTNYTRVDFKGCFFETWDRFGRDVPRQTMRHTELKATIGSALFERHDSTHQQQFLERTAMEQSFALL